MTHVDVGIVTISVAKGSDVHVMTCEFAIVSGDAMFTEIEPRNETS